MGKSNLAGNKASQSFRGGGGEDLPPRIVDSFERRKSGEAVRFASDP